MATFDYLVGPVTCVACGHACNDASSNMQTKLQARPALSELTIGDELDVDWNNVCSAGYIRVSAPKKRDSISLLETWECPNCGKPFNWARVVIADARIESIREIALSAENLLDANYISDDCRFLLGASTVSEVTIEALVAWLQAS